ncbi:unnamed protein product, partial [Mesorhabditis belari]|uniref:Uncharacterized protein n=1 Tax=Mesorhabditis belari TaxID=2138241 RepID=A0AAF3E8C5_9BILA
MSRRGQPRGVPVIPIPDYGVVDASSSDPMASYYSHHVYEALIQVQKQMKPTRGRMPANKIDLQPYIDEKIFEITKSGYSRMDPFKKLILMRYILDYFKKDDPHKMLFFETIFFGHEGEPELPRHETRIRFLFDIASYALLYPAGAIFVQIAQWMTRNNNTITYGKDLIDRLCLHYIKHEIDDEEGQMEQFLLPMTTYSADFCVMFLTFGPIQENILNEIYGPRMARICGHYLLSHTSFVVNSCRDMPELGKIFCKTSFPLLLEYVLKRSNVVDISMNDLHDGLLRLLKTWKEKELIPELTLLGNEDEAEWSQRKHDYMNLSSGTNVIAMRLVEIKQSLKRSVKSPIREDF